MNYFNGVKDFEGIKILSVAEIEEEQKDELFQREFPFKVIPLAKYNYEYSYFVFDENGKIYKYYHDNENLRFKYPDFLAFILEYSFFYALKGRVYEDLNYSSVEVDNLVAYFENLLLEKLTTFNFILDAEYTPNWSNWSFKTIQ